MPNRMAEQIKDNVDLREAMEHYGIHFNRSGYAVCPFHTEKTASLSIQKKKNRFTCFGCGATGDVIEFVKMYFNLDFGQALVRLNNDFRLGLTSEKPNAKSTAIAKEEARIRKAWKEHCQFKRILYLMISDAYAELMRLGAGKEVLDLIEDWLDNNLGRWGEWITTKEWRWSGESN